ncbi:TetR/AcrR family transcriptional regulator C-terminal domain-containing protein [Sporolactobacillus nakayamae]|uniref:Transcriptional regulator, TetR family n=1 Tax=Sporolactobacillus nakayamae TaxID=269670 RepID=A0A1I2WAU3_9BACL|nr:TetR/AcrR family transcriptional regulator C-terminal domain-containing protein [Sporolactobacillus nakayamae]SFG97176.1 transcriptional regulator, TetR family [Sporolactobacillus nakayamae]
MSINKKIVIDEALKLLNAEGISNVSLRAIAKRLDVKAPTLYWHIKNKAALLNEMAEQILQSQLSDILIRNPQDNWREWLIHVFNQLRKALLSYTDGARVVAGAHFSQTMADLNEKVLQVLLASGISLRDSRLLLLTTTHFTFGYVIEEQTNLDTEMRKNFDMELFAQKHPVTIAGIKEYFNSGRNKEDLFNDELKLIIKI